MGILLWPFKALWRLIGFLLGMVGRLAAAIIGLVLIVVGIIITMTIVGAIIGIPLIAFGFLLVVRSLF